MSEWAKLWEENQHLIEGGELMLGYQWLKDLKTVGDGLAQENKQLHETLAITYKDLEEVMDEKQKLVNYHYQKRLEVEQKLEAIRVLLPNDVNSWLVRQILEVLGDD